MDLTVDVYLNPRPNVGQAMWRDDEIFVTVSFKNIPRKIVRSSNIPSFVKITSTPKYINISINIKYYFGT